MEDLFKPRFKNFPYKLEEIKPVSLDAINGYFDASPVRILYGGMQNTLREKEESLVYETVVNMGVDVDKGKLLHALAYDRMQYYEGFRAGEKAAQPKWISVEERLPEIGRTVICCAKGHIPILGTGWYDANHKMWHLDFDVGRIITHWMPLPEPPKEDS